MGGNMGKILYKGLHLRIREEEYLKYMVDGKDFIERADIDKYLKIKIQPDKYRIRDILAKSLQINTLSLEETALLINVSDKELIEEMEETAYKVKKKVYDNRIVFFAPLYISNLCINNCLYCGFRKENTMMERKCLALEEVEKEVEVLCGNIGHKRLIVVFGEHPQTDVNCIKKTIERIYKVKVKTKRGFGNIRRVNVNIPPLSIQDLRELNEVGIGTYQVFQETYHKEMYGRLHPQDTIKGNYLWRLYVMHRAQEAGIDDVGIGVLFGLYDWRYEVLGLVAHSLELEERFGVGPHTISFPRLEPAFNTPFVDKSIYKVSDEDLRKIVVILRLAIPYAGMILTARESAQLRDELIPLGITQIDAASNISIGGYSQGKIDNQEGKRQQFFLGDTRSLDTMIGELAKRGYISSFCTAGYRCGRTGSNIMTLLKSGQEGKFCKLNAVLTFREWLDDFASFQTKEIGEALIEQEIREIEKSMPKIYPQFIKLYQRIKDGERDLYF